MSRNVEDLLPLPRQAQAAEGSYDTVGQYWRVEAGAATDPAVEWKLEHELAVRHGASVMLSDNTVVVGSPPEQDAAPPPRPQAYALHVGPEGFVLRGHDVEGLYWGLVTVEQLLDGGTELPCLRMTDWPAFPLRGHHDDISRKQVSTLEDFRRIIRRLSAYKINAYTPYMEDMLYLKSHPDVGEGRGRLTPDEVEAIHLEARRHKVLIMPTYSLIGHQENLLANPDYAHLGREVFQTMSSLDPDKPAVREFLTDVIRDVCELFPGPYFHAGFDETQGVTAEQFLRHANWCARQLRRYGKRMPMWVDMIYNHFGCEMIGELEDNIIPVNWAYGCTEDVPHHRELVAQGRPVWGLAGYGNWCAFLPDFGHAKSNIDAWKRVGLETDTPALFASQWGDDGYENHRDMCWNLFAYLGEATWSGAEGRRKDFERRFQLSFYGAELPELTEILEHLPGRLSRDPREYWALFRRNAFAMARWAEKNPDAIGHLDRDEQLLEQALGALEGARKRAERRAGHLNHFRVSVLRTLSVVHRLQLACRHGVEAAPGAVAAVAGELETVRDAYEEDWLRNNKRPNIEVSLAVYDRLLDSYERLQQTERAAPGARDGYYLLDFSK
ncbi:MAG: glycoside hydrolase family 20 zincin-like fold domain-containing protein, partial [Candidatus Brocadiia bacterium]